MPNSGDVVDLELGMPEGREAGFRHPAVLVTSQRILDAGGEARVVEVPGMPHGFELVPSPVQERVLRHALGFLDGIERSRALVRGHARR